MDYRSMGLAVGLIVGLLLCMVLFKFMNKDGRMKSRYDEMQEKARGNAYKYAFWTLAGCEALVSLISSFGIRLFNDPFTANLTCIIIAGIVQASYSIWHDAYMALNTNYKRFTIIMIVVGIINLVSAIIGIVTGNMIADGVLQTPFANLMCAVIFLAVGIELFLKNTRDAGNEEEV